MNDNDTLEVLPPSALGALERAAIDVQVATAHQWPRSIELFKKRAMTMVATDLETAESCIYSRPVGKGDDGKQKYAEGASIRMAEIVAACYGNIRVGARIIEQTERYVKAEGVAHDLESNYAAKSEAMESTVKRNGQPYDERMRIVVGKACLSKALRDAVFRVVPKALCKSVYDAAEKVIAGQQKTIEQRRKAVKEWLASIRVDDARTFAALGVQGWSEVGEEQLLTLTGLKTGIKDNELTIAEAFPSVGGETAKAADLSDLGPQPAATPATPVNGKAATTPEKAATATPAPAAVCKYCGQEVEDMGSHSCEGLQKALAEAKAPAPEKATAAPEPDQHKAAMTKLYALMAESEVTPEMMLKFTLANVLRKKDQKLVEISTAKINNIVSSWALLLPELLKLKEAKP